MQYFVSVIDDRSESATADEMATIGAYNQRLRDQGHWVFAAGLGSPDLDVALELAADGSRACNRLLEVRPFP